VDDETARTLNVGHGDPHAREPPSKNSRFRTQQPWGPGENPGRFCRRASSTCRTKSGKPKQVPWLTLNGIHFATRCWNANGPSLTNQENSVGSPSLYPRKPVWNATTDYRPGGPICPRQIVFNSLSGGYMRGPFRLPARGTTFSTFRFRPERRSAPGDFFQAVGSRRTRLPGVQCSILRFHTTSGRCCKTGRPQRFPCRTQFSGQRHSRRNRIDPNCAGAVWSFFPKGPTPRPRRNKPQRLNFVEQL